VLHINEPIAVLSAVETVAPTIRPRRLMALCKMANRGQIVGAIRLTGLWPWTSRSAAKRPGSSSSFGRSAAIILDLESGNMLAGIVLGAPVPVILTSRANSAEMRLLPAAFAVNARG
jgi:phosphate acetyltransferase